MRSFVFIVLDQVRAGEATVTVGASGHRVEIVVPDVDEHELVLEVDGLPVSSVGEIGY